MRRKCLALFVRTLPVQSDVAADTSNLELARLELSSSEHRYGLRKEGNREVGRLTLGVENALYMCFIPKNFQVLKGNSRMKRKGLLFLNKK